MLHPCIRDARPAGPNPRPRRCRTNRADHYRSARAGHGFGFTEIAGHETRLAVIPKSYHKINTGPFVQTPFGLRLLRQAEIERIHGHTLLTRRYATAVQILGQGVQTRVFRSVFRQLADHLVGAAAVTPAV